MNVWDFSARASGAISNVAGFETNSTLPAETQPSTKNATFEALQNCVGLGRPENRPMNSLSPRSFASVSERGDCVIWFGSLKAQ